MNRKIAVGLVVTAVVAAGGYVLFIFRSASAGPYGGDLVPLDDGAAYAEILANKESGELMSHIWEKDLRTAHPLPNEPIIVGSGNNTVQLMPHPMPNDPAGTCSRFYGQADWVRNGNMQHGWLQRGQSRHEFTWNRCWSGGQTIGNMWQGMQGHRMGSGGHEGHNGSNSRHNML